MRRWMSFGGLFAGTACSLAGGFDGFTGDPNAGALATEGGVEGRRPPLVVPPGGDAGADRSDSSVGVALCNEPGVFCDGFERTDPLGRWGGTTSTNGGSIRTAAEPKPPEGSRFAEFSIASQLSQDGGARSATFLYYDKPSIRQVYYRARIRLDRRPSNGEYGEIASIVMNDGTRDTGNIAVAMTPTVTILNFSSYPADPTLRVYTSVKTGPWPVDVWSLLELRVDLTALNASLTLDGQAAATIALKDVGPGTVIVAAGLPYYTAEQGHPEFHVQLDDVLLKMSE